MTFEENKAKTVSYMVTLLVPHGKVLTLLTEKSQRAMAVSSGIWNLCSLTLPYQLYFDSFWAGLVESSDTNVTSLSVLNNIFVFHFTGQ